MDIVSRIKQFLEDKSFSVSQFADTCTIPRPTVSQLLNGRNKKVSDEIISKIHRAYPYLSISWLLFGEGGMYVGDSTNSESVAGANLDENLFSCMNIGDDGEFSNVQPLNSDSFDINSTLNRSGSAPETYPAASASVCGEMSEKNSSQPYRPESGPSKSGKDRRVVNIIVYYSDNSFEQFAPAFKK